MTDVESKRRFLSRDLLIVGVCKQFLELELLQHVAYTFNGIVGKDYFQWCSRNGNLIIY